MKWGKSKEEGGLLCWIRGEDAVGTRSNTRMYHIGLGPVFLVVDTPGHDEVIDVFAVAGRVS